MLSDKSTVCPNNLLDLAHQKKGIKVAIANAGKTLPMISVMDAVKAVSYTHLTLPTTVIV